MYSCGIVTPVISRFKICLMRSQFTLKVHITERSFNVSSLRFPLYLYSVNKVILFNPRSARAKHRIPNSILQVAASIHGKYEYAIVDGNLEKDPWLKIKKYLDSGDFRFFGVTVMPGPQLR